MKDKSIMPFDPCKCGTCLECVSSKPAAHTPLPWTVYQCSFCKKEDPTSACGFNDVGLDMSHDECHHPLELEDAAFIVRAVNAHSELVNALQACLESEYLDEDGTRTYVIRGDLRTVVQNALGTAEGIAKAEGK